LNGGVAQIGHLPLHPTLNIFVLETKHFTAGVKITEEGELLRRNPSTKSSEGVPSLLAQNERHIAVLKDAFDRIEQLGQKEFFGSLSGQGGREATPSRGYGARGVITSGVLTTPWR
jgi:hypothetical protein